LQIIESIITFIIIMVGYYFFRHFIGKIKVLDYIKRKYPKYIIESVKWTLFGPIAPGGDNIKFKVILRSQNKSIETKKIIYAVTSFFGEVYINDNYQ